MGNDLVLLSSLEMGVGTLRWVGSTKACGVSEQVVECLVSSADPDWAPKNLSTFLCPGFEGSKGRGEVHWDVISSFVNSEPWTDSVRVLGHLGRKYRPDIDVPVLEEEPACLCSLPCVWAGNGSLMFASTPDGSLGLLEPGTWLSPPFPFSLISMIDGLVWKAPHCPKKLK